MTPPMLVAKKLARMIGLTISTVTRWAWNEPEADYQEYIQDEGYGRSAVFARTEGAVHIMFTMGKGLRIFFHEGAQSIDLRPLVDDEDFEEDERHPIACDDPVFSTSYWAALKGAVIQDILVHRAVRDDGRPGQQALSFKLSNGMWFAAAFNIFKESSILLHLCPYEEMEKVAPGLITESMSVADPRAAQADWGTWEHA